MKIIKTSINGLVVIEPKIFYDSRGYFFESYNQNQFLKKLGDFNFVQDNESKSSKGVLRGFHFQKPPYEQAKLVRCIKGQVLDVALDLRKKSKTFGKYFMIELSEKNSKSIFIAEGFAHGFLCLDKENYVVYSCTNYRHEKSEVGIVWNDSDLKIKWPNKKPLISLKDKKNLSFSEYQKKFIK